MSTLTSIPASSASVAYTRRDKLTIPVAFLAFMALFTFAGVVLSAPAITITSGIVTALAVPAWALSTALPDQGRTTDE